MGHFADIFRIKLNADEGTVRLSVRSADERADEHIVDIRDFNVVTQDVESGWYGTYAIEIKRKNKTVIVAIRESQWKRAIYNVSYPHWRQVCEQFISLIRSEGLEIQAYIPTTAKNISVNVNSDEIANTVLEKLSPLLTDAFSSIRGDIQQITTSPNLMKVTAVHDPNKPITEAIFIPETVVSDLKGDAKVLANEGDGNQVDDALATLRKMKNKTSEEK